MRHTHSNPDSEQEHEHRPSTSQTIDNAVPLHMPSQDDLPGRQGTTIRRKLAQKLAPRLGNKAFQRQYVQREEESDESPDVVFPPAFSHYLTRFC